MSTPNQPIPGNGSSPIEVQDINRPVGVKYGGFWIRFGAFIIDAIILKIFLFIIAALFFGGVAAEHASALQHGVNATPEEMQKFVVAASPIGLISLGFWWLYFTLLESSGWQATVGKKIFGLKVIDENMNRISWGRANGRFWAKIISAIILYIGFFMIGWTERKQGLHDKIADTFVIRS